MIVKNKKNSIYVNNKLLNKYRNIEEIFDKEVNKIEYNLIFNKFISEVENSDFKNVKVEKLKKLFWTIFVKYHDTNIFLNNNIEIYISKSGINECVQKIYYSKNQKNLIKEHLIIFSKLGKIIERSKLVNQVYERKGRDKYIIWNYYLDGIIINSKKYILEFEVVTMNNLKNVYRIQRLKYKNK